jgi:hypothetical protein
MLTRAQGGVTLGLEQGELKADFSHLGKTAEVQNAGSRYFGHGNPGLNVTYPTIDSG